MRLQFVHLFPDQLGLNGESGNLACLVQRLSWAGIASEVVAYDGIDELPDRVDAVFIGSGTLAGAIESLEKIRSEGEKLRKFATAGVPFFAVGLGWEILGHSITLTDGKTLEGVGIFPCQSVRTQQRASAECYGFDGFGNLTTGYANHSAEIELFQGEEPLIELREGFGNSSTLSAKKAPGEGLISRNLMAARLNGPFLPLNPHIADRFLGLVAERSGVSYQAGSDASNQADFYAANAREELRRRLSS